ncbi:uracil-DNA glycosylase [Corynebacterium sp. H128]|uniref:uracil-DNA glycosylase n=1 Tax=unclassified Corynebacterium TaxID=2624378 RepID=UPI00309EB47B
MHPSWEPVFAPIKAECIAMRSTVGEHYLPPEAAVFRAFQTPFDQVKVLIIGQDPYPTPGHAMGLSFSVAPDVRPLPRSLNNIFAEYHTDLGLPIPTCGDLSPWAEQGVMLLNRVLTVAPGQAGSHRGLGWEAITEHVVRALAARNQPLVAILWGRDAQTAKAFLGDCPVIESVHPSPLSARRGFFGSRPFTRANEQLRALGAEPVNWEL